MRRFVDWLFGPKWAVVLASSAGSKVVYVRARNQFYAKWKGANKLHDAMDPQVGYVAFKWLNGLQLDEDESVLAVEIHD